MKLRTRIVCHRPLLLTEINFPKLRLGVKALSTFTLFICIAFLANTLGFSAVLSITISLASVFLVILLGVFYRRKKLMSYLKRHGSKVKISEVNEDDYKSVMGAIPISDGHSVVIVYANQVEIIFGRLGCYRRLMWDEITFVREDSYAQKSILELCAGSVESNNRLCIPWSRNFKKFIPENLV